MITLRSHQDSMNFKLNEYWAERELRKQIPSTKPPLGPNVLSVLPTGAGKTILMAHLAKEEIKKGGTVLLFAHRDVLLEQISMALCAFGLRHNFITSGKTQKEICNIHVEEHGMCFRDENAKIIVCSVDTFYRRNVEPMCKNVTLWLMDEAHHLLDDSKWNKCIRYLSDVKGVGVTATPIRADKKGLGRCADGCFDYMITDKDVGATMHDLILNSSLSLYKVFTPPVKLKIDDVNVTQSGDLNNKKLAKATDNSEITGDAVEHYRKLAHNKQAIIFTVNIAHSDHVAEQFRDAGYNAVSVSSKTKSAERRDIVKRFRRGEIKILVNCDLFGEGFDVPAVECVIMLRKTFSYALFKQQFGRVLRQFKGKKFGILIDHVGNVEYMMRTYRLKYPHDDPTWSLDRPKPKAKRKLDDGFEIELDDKPYDRTCPNCFFRYTPVGDSHTCPECNHSETPIEELDAARAFQHKKGNLVELNVDIIEDILKRRAEIDRSPEFMKNYMKNAPHPIKTNVVNRHTTRLNAQHLLRDQIHKWCMFHFKIMGIKDIDLIQRQFELEFGVHPIQAAVLSASEANTLRERIEKAEMKIIYH